MWPPVRSQVAVGCSDLHKTLYKEQARPLLATKGHFVCRFKLEKVRKAVHSRVTKVMDYQGFILSAQGIAPSNQDLTWRCPLKCSELSIVVPVFDVRLGTQVTTIISCSHVKRTDTRISPGDCDSHIVSNKGRLCFASGTLKPPNSELVLSLLSGQWCGSGWSCQVICIPWRSTMSDVQRSSLQVLNQDDCMISVRMKRQWESYTSDGQGAPRWCISENAFWLFVVKREMPEIQSGYPFWGFDGDWWIPSHSTSPCRRHEGMSNHDRAAPVMKVSTTNAHGVPWVPWVTLERHTGVCQHAFIPRGNSDFISGTEPQLEALVTAEKCSLQESFKKDRMFAFVD